MELGKSIFFKINNMNCEFRTLHDSDVSKEYVDGLKQQTKYIMNIPKNVSISSQKKYVKDILYSKDDTICGLFINNELVGTAGIALSNSIFQNIDNPYENLVTIGIYIFNKSYRGIGLGKVLVWAASYLFYDFTQAKWFTASMQKENIASLKSFLSCGFQHNIRLFPINENKEGVSVLLNISELKKPIIIDTVSI